MSWQNEIKKVWTDRTGKDTTFFAKEIPFGQAEMLLHFSGKLDSIINEYIKMIENSEWLNDPKYSHYKSSKAAKRVVDSLEEVNIDYDMDAINSMVEGQHRSDMENRGG